MADHCKLTASLQYSTESDYDPELVPIPPITYASRPAGIQVMRAVSIPTGGETFELGGYSSIDWVLVKNRGTTNYVTASFTNNANTAVSQRVGVDSTTTQGKVGIFTDVKPSGDLTITANTAAVVCDVIIVGTRP